jgi:hypothetical protein
MILLKTSRQDCGWRDNDRCTLLKEGRSPVFARCFYCSDLVHRQLSAHGYKTNEVDITPLQNKKHSICHA